MKLIIPAGALSGPTVTPPTGNSGTLLVEWIPGTYAEVNVTGGIGYTLLDSLNFNQRDMMSY